MKSQEFIASLEEWIDEEPFLTNRTDLIDSEIEKNCYSISMSQKMAKDFDSTMLVRFLSRLKKRRIRYAKESDFEGGMRYYSWFDEQACQFKFNLINSNHKELPFGATIEKVGSENEIIQAFLASVYHDGIPMEELSDEVKPDSEPDDFKVRVYIEELI